MHHRCRKQRRSLWQSVRTGARFPPHGSRPRDHGHRWCRKVFHGGRTGASLFARFPRETHRPCERRSLQAKNRRCPSRRPHPDERHPLGPRVHAFARHTSIEPRVVASRAGGPRHFEGGSVRFDCARNEWHRPKRHRNHGPQRRVAVRDDARVWGRHTARENRHARLRGCGGDQQV